MTDRPIVDLTELPGVYDIAIAWESDDPRFAVKLAALRAAAASGATKGGATTGAAVRRGEIKGSGINEKPGESTEEGPAVSLFAAVQQKLGLKLDPRKLPADLIVIDRANPMPVEN